MKILNAEKRSVSMTNKRKLLWMIAIILYLAALVSFVAGCRNAVAYPQGSFDFQYDSAKVFSLRVDPYKETMNSTGLSQKLGLEKFYNGLEANQFPSMLMLLLPYTLLSPMAANWAWMISNVLFSIGIVFLIKKLFFDKWYLFRTPSGSMTNCCAKQRIEKIFLALNCCRFVDKNDDLLSIYHPCG